MKKLFTLGFMLSVVISYAQIGIETDTPQSELDVNGSIQFRGELKVGGNQTMDPDFGELAQAITSEGEGDAPKWRKLKVPFLEDEQYQLINSYGSLDRVGISFPTGGATGGTTSSINESLNTNWSVIDGLSVNVEVNNPDNKIALLFQSGVELSKTTSNNQNIKYICGAFFNGKLKAMRPNQIDAINGAEKNQSLITISYTVLNVEPGEQLVQIACRKTATTIII